MKRIIPLITALIAMAVPALMSAQMTNYNYWNVTSLLVQVENAINSDNFSFDTEAHKQDFLDGIELLYTYRDAEMWSSCVTVANNLASAASQWIVDTNVAYNVNQLCICVGDIYEEEPTSFESVSIDPDDEDTIDEGLYDLCKLKIRFYIEVVHCHECEDCLQAGIRITRE